jgi:hypothetical protein
MREQTLLRRRIKSARNKAITNRARNRSGERRRSLRRLTPYTRQQQPRRYCPACSAPAVLHTEAGCQATHRRGYACPCRPEQLTSSAAVAANRAAVGIDPGRITVTIGPISGRGCLLDRLDWDSLFRLQTKFPDKLLVNTAVARAALALVRDVA